MEVELRGESLGGAKNRQRFGCLLAPELGKNKTGLKMAHPPFCNLEVANSIQVFVLLTQFACPSNLIRIPLRISFTAYTTLKTNEKKTFHGAPSIDRGIIHRFCINPPDSNEDGRV
jgi:hypothetical protein